MPESARAVGFPVTDFMYYGWRITGVWGQALDADPFFSKSAGVFVSLQREQEMWFLERHVIKTNEQTKIIWRDA